MSKVAERFLLSSDRSENVLAIWCLRRVADAERPGVRLPIGRDGSGVGRSGCQGGAGDEHNGITRAQDAAPKILLDRIRIEVGGLINNAMFQ